MSLEEYNKKRDFKKTNEPRGDIAPQNGELRFVIQRHDASHLHFDLRLEIDGVLKSWAIPKGPSMNPNDKRLAVQTEDHPLKYLDFQGIIPKGNYGAGEMTIWDSGTFTSMSDDMDILKMIEDGDLKITFIGTKLKGDFALVRTNFDGKKPQWLLIKKKDKYATELDYDANLHLSETSIDGSAPPSKSFKLSQQVAPMLATTSKELKFSTSKNWLYEIKWDGYRMICNHSSATTTLYSRNGIDYSNAFPSLVKHLKELSKSAILDGEVVTLDKNGASKFQWLQHYSEEPKGDLIYVVFDLLYLDGHSIAHLKLEDRKELLEALVEDIPQIRYSDHIVGGGKAFFEKVKEQGLEGIIGKKADSFYYPGVRSESWVKFKTQESIETIICGYTKSENRPFGSLILGLYKNNELSYVGNCGTGFSISQQREMKKEFDKITQLKSPFPDKINLAGRQAVWLQPHQVAEVTFAEWTEKGRLRQPVFKGFRSDKIPQKLELESPKLSTHANNTSDNSLEIDGINVPVSNLEKPLWPKDGITKYDLIDYYIAVSEYILPFLKDRPQNLHRHPNGIEKESFYQKDTPEGYPDWIETVKLYSESSDKNIDYMLCQKEATLIYMANLGCIEINPWNSRVGSLEKPDYIVIDLDPSEKNDFQEVVEVAQSFHHLLNELGIEGYCKTSGSSGLHIYIPMGAVYTFEEARNFCKLLCTIIQEQLPKLTTMERPLKARKGRIYLDYLQNRSAQTLASVYCVRPKHGATVSTPLLWKEVNMKLDKGDFTIFTVMERIEKFPDLFKEVLGKGVSIEKTLERLEGG
ncbi:bifunctional non-homologous end joining protein LigD [Algoriphagus ratkowskyi]|uniref:DNA ligase (ATP) n=1 Tax=Algoriphagus ratkowskyi TaxID=57028 RepID=A0A2W7SEL3_9BACT|nr:DNA ligase D [Algoriphagus ratkowskyi]PZX61285.1 bifunctional non-homologous end joining protein LigD [Algoriphagus ratkowskyi]TXD79398.1 DNA ligase D [Algoriphagus ratkowskyi]